MKSLLYYCIKCKKMTMFEFLKFHTDSGKQYRCSDCNDYIFLLYG